MRAPDAGTELRAVASAIFGRRDLAPTSARAALVGLLYRHAEGPTDRPPLLHIADGLKAAATEAARLGCPGLAERLRTANAFALKLA